MVDGRFNLLPKGILKSGDLISSALHCQSCQVQRARRKERLLSRPSGGGEDRREEWSRKGRTRDGVKLNENPIFCIGKSFDGRERPFSRSLHRTWQRKHKTRPEDIVACPLSHVRTATKREKTHSMTSFDLTVLSFPLLLRS